MPTPPLPPPPPVPTPEEFRPENFKSKSSFRDYVIYAFLLAILLSVAGGFAYYYTRSGPEKAELQARFKHTVGDLAPRQDAKPLVLKVKPSDLTAIMNEGDTTAAQSAQPAQPATTTVNVSAYSGGRQARVLTSDNPRLPKASPEFISFVEGLKVNGVFQGHPARLMLDGHLFHAGDVIDAESGVIFVDVDSFTKCFRLRDKTGAELRLTY